MTVDRIVHTVAGTFILLSLALALSLCKDAPNWDARAAVDWWLDHEREAISPLPVALLKA